jgi:hypothetical protein
MIRGTTAQFRFNLPYEFDNVEKVRVVFWQPDNSAANIVKEKDRGGCGRCDGYPKALLVTLTPNETWLFSEKSKAYVQLRGRCNEGDCFGTLPEPITVYPMHDDVSFDLDTDFIIPGACDCGYVHLDGNVITSEDDENIIMFDGQSIT